jgi:hypothetical protein
MKTAVILTVSGMVILTVLFIYEVNKGKQTKLTLLGGSIEVK